MVVKETEEDGWREDRINGKVDENEMDGRQGEVQRVGATD